MSSVNLVGFLLTLSSLSIPSSGLYEIKLKPSLDKITKSLGHSIVFTCEVTGSTNSNIKIQWIDQNKREIPRNSVSAQRKYVENDGEKIRKLYITAIENADAGKYSCVTHVGGVKQEKHVELVLFKDITFDRVPNPQNPQIHTDYLVECQVSGEPMPVVSFRYNALPIEYGTGSRYSQEKNGLRIKKISQSDDGNYTCRAEVEADGRYDERKIEVVVHIPPKITKALGQVNGTEGDRVTLSCKADGFPSPEFKFYKNEKQVLPSTERVNIDEKIGQVTFVTLKKEDEGRYTCKAINDVGEKSEQGSLKVFVPPKIYELKNITKSEDGAGALVCKSHGDPPPTMAFRKDGNPEEYRMGNNDKDHVVVSSKGSGHLELSIKRLIPSDRSGYTCISHNFAGRDESVGFIDVQYTPRFPADHATQAYSWAGRVHNITCHVQAHPPPIIKWLRNDLILENNDTYRIFESELNSSLQIKVKEVDQGWIYGDFVCRAKNTKGEQQIKIHLNRATVPEAPSKVIVKEYSPNMVVLSIEPPKETGGVKVIGYRVEYDGNIQDFSIAGDGPSKIKSPSNGISGIQSDRAAPSGRHSTVDQNVTEKDIVLENLRPGTKYLLRIRAKNEVGVGNLMEYAVVTANRSKPYPIKLTSPEQGQDSYRYRVTWEKPKTGGWPIKEYEFKYKKSKSQGVVGNEVEPKDEWIIKTELDNPERPRLDYLITGLEPLTEYELAVVARNDMGESKPAGRFFFRTSEATAADLMPVRSSMSAGAVVAITIAIFLMILIIVDISCYFLNGCGFTMFVCVHLCEKIPSKNKQMNQETDNKEMVNQPLHQVEEGLCSEVQCVQEVEEKPEPECPDPVEQEEEKKRLSNRKSVLSQGDERWKDVVQELERELSMKKPLNDNDDDVEKLEESIPAETNDEDLKQIDSEIPEKLDNTASEVGIVEEVETEKEEESKEEEHDTTGEENEKDVDDEKQVERIIESDDKKLIEEEEKLEKEKPLANIEDTKQLLLDGEKQGENEDGEQKKLLQSGDNPAEDG